MALWAAQFRSGLYMADRYRQLFEYIEWTGIELEESVEKLEEEHLTVLGGQCGKQLLHDSGRGQY